MTIAETIYKQLGGQRFVAMTGAKQFGSQPDGLTFAIGRNKTSANRVRVSLKNDLYDIRFSRVSMKRTADFGLDVKDVDVSTHTGVGVEQLREVFTSVTGLHTSL